MACRLVGAKPLSNQCWNIVYSNTRNKFQWNTERNSYIFIQENSFDNVVYKIAAILSRPQYVKKLYQLDVIAQKIKHHGIMFHPNRV